MNCKNHSFFVTALFCWLQMVTGLNKNAHSDRILARQRRYLVFPAGSSIQFVCDMDTYFPGWTPSYPITSISIALAWALPDRPNYPENNLMHLYEEGNLPLRRKDTNATNNTAPEESNTTAAPQREPNHISPETIMKLIHLFLPNGHSATPSAESMELDANHIEAIFNYINSLDDTIRPKDTNKYWNKSTIPSNRANQITPNDYNQSYHPPLVSTHSSVRNSYANRNTNDAFKRYLANTYIRPWIESTTSKILKTPILKEAEKVVTNSSPFKPKMNKLHRIYPAPGKRNVHSNSMTWEEKFFLDRHRASRHEFYEIIEKYLFARGYNGTACVLKTLCEVGKKRSDSEPSTFLAELIRVIFSLPTAVRQTKYAIDKRHVHYDEAHEATEDCAKKFIQCPNSIWEAKFMIEYYD